MGKLVHADGVHRYQVTPVTHRLRNIAAVSIVSAVLGLTVLNGAVHAAVDGLRAATAPSQHVVLVAPAGNTVGR